MAKKKSAAPFTQEHAAQLDMMFKNGLGEALLGFNPNSIGTQLSQADTLFKNNRWYLVSNMRQLLSEIYVEHGLVQTIVNVPVDDGMRGGVVITSKQLSPEQIDDLQVAMERQDILGSVVGMATKWNRLFGGAGIIIMTDQDPSLPLNIQAIRPDSPLEFRAVDMWELFYDMVNTEQTTLQGDRESFQTYNYYGQKLDKSRVMKMKGLVAPSFIRPRLRGWGFSVVEALVRSINQYLKSNNLAFEVLDEFKIDVYKIKNLSQSLMSEVGANAIRRRVQIANQEKNYNSAITMDVEDDYAQKQLSFTGIAEVMKEIRMQIASDMRMPLTKIFGISAAGFSSGEDDIENYNAMVESDVRAKCKYEILHILELMCQKKFGFVPDDLRVEFKPLRIMSGIDEETVKTQKFARLLQALQTGAIDGKTFADGCNKDNLLPVQIDPNLADTLEIGGDDNEGDTEDGDQAKPGSAPAPGGKNPPKNAKPAKEAKETP